MDPARIRMDFRDFTSIYGSELRAKCNFKYNFNF